MLEVAILEVRQRGIGAMQAAPARAAHDEQGRPAAMSVPPLAFWRAHGGLE
jgi:hypothetical protein